MPRPQGRPRKVALDAIVDDALRVFWDQGYARTSISDLTRATGCHPGALYQSFGSKWTLFLAALQRYSERGLRRVDTALDGQPRALDGLRAYLLDQIDLSWSATGSRGCLMANSSLEVLPGAPDGGSAIAGHFQHLRQRLSAAVRTAQQQGDLSDDRPPDVIALYLLLIAEGMFVLGRTQPGRDEFAAAAELALSLLRPQTSEAEATP
jgi:TetR/AcrR family transcriptional repressor of nem operon